MPDNFIDSLVNQLKSLYNASSDGETSIPTTPSKNSLQIDMGKGSGKFQAPIKGSWNSSGGYDESSKRPNGRTGHKGVDLRVPAGTPVYPMTEGVVSNVGTDPIGGNIVTVQHPNNIKSYYAHLSTVKVQKGDKVDMNTVLGAVGDTGNAKGTFPHCHFQVWKDGVITNPANFFSVPKYTNLTKEEKANGPWLSDKAKQDAMAFNMKKHLDDKNKRIAYTADVIVKIAEYFEKLTF